MRELQRRLQRDLGRIADAAPVSSESWQLLRHRIAAEPDRTEEEVIVLTPTEPTLARPRWSAAVALAAAAALVIAGIIALRADDDSSTLMTDDGPATVADAFDPAVGDLCARVSGGDVVAHLVAAGDDVEGPATPIEPATEDATGWDCAWVLASGEEIQLGARSTGPRPQTEPVDPEEPGSGYTGYRMPGQIMEVGAYVIGHPELSEGVAVENMAFLRFGFYPVGSDHILNVRYSSDDAMCDDAELGEAGSCNTAGYETVLMRTADALLHDLGWTESTEPVEEDSAPVTDVDWQPGPSLPGQLDQVAAWSDGLAAILDVDGDETPAGGEVWYSTDGVDWSDEAPSLPDAAYRLAGQNGDLFALTGDPDDAGTPQTLWYRRAGQRWTEVITDVALDHMAVGPDRLIAYGQGGFTNGQAGFTILGVFDTATLAPVEFADLPEIEFGPTDTVPSTGEPFVPAAVFGHAIALDEGFLAEVQWMTGVEDGEAVTETGLLYSADGSAWIEHPDLPDGAVLLPYWGTTPVYDGLNLLSQPNNQSFDDWITDDGLSFSAATNPGVGDPTGTEDGFFSVDGRNRIHRSTDGVEWDVLEAPATWSFPGAVAGDAGEVQHGSIFTLGGRLVAIGIRGDFEGWVGFVNPTTEVWVADF